MKIIGMIILLIGCFILWQHFELKKFRITSYEYQTDKITQSVNFAVVADLHAHVYGRDNDILIQKIKEQKPDIILVPGDMIVSRYPETYETAYQTFEKLTEIAPVYFSNGNHESRVSKVPVMQTEEFLEYENRVRKLGVHILNNASEEVILHGGKFCISGLEIPLECYGKGSYEPLPEHFIRDVLGDAKQDSVQILMAHNPMFAKEYATDTENVKGTIAKSVISDATDDKNLVAPGTEGNMVSMTIEGKPEVAVNVKYTATVTLRNWLYKDREESAGEYYCPIKIRVGTVNYYGYDYGSAELFKNAVETAINEYSANYKPGTDLNNANAPVVSWAWAFEDNAENAKQTDEKDTYLGDQAAKGNAATIALEVVTTVTQID